jgi:hypothetical protein
MVEGYYLHLWGYIRHQQFHQEILVPSLEIKVRNVSVDAQRDK